MTFATCEEKAEGRRSFTTSALNAESKSITDFVHCVNMHARKSRDFFFLLTFPGAPGGPLDPTSPWGKRQYVHVICILITLLQLTLQRDHYWDRGGWLWRYCNTAGRIHNGCLCVTSASIYIINWSSVWNRFVVSLPCLPFHLLAHLVPPVLFLPMKKSQESQFEIFQTQDKNTFFLNEINFGTWGQPAAHEGGPGGYPAKLGAVYFTKNYFCCIIISSDL